MDKSSPIGVFDSGIGGLTVVKEIIKTLPRESIIYLGDTARVPYGPRSREVVTGFALQMADFLLKKKVKAIVIACNTISGLSYDDVKTKAFPVITLGVIKGVVKKAISATRNNKIGVIGTVGTINSQSYQKLLKFYNSDAEIVSSACPLFVPLAEEGMNNHQATKLIAHEYLKQFIDKGVDTLILGCTHYPLLYDSIKEVMGEDVAIIDSAQPTAQMLKERLNEADLLADEDQKPTYDFFVTDAPERVIRVASHFFGEDLNNKIQKITL